MKILFQGDSITDAGRDHRNYHNLGDGYPKYAAEHIREEYPDVDFEFINFGISGNRTHELFDRLYADCICFQPDVVSILIGINDVWHRYGFQKIATTDEQIKLNYRSMLERIKNETDAKIIMIQPYLLDAESIDYLRADHAKLIAIIKELADEGMTMVIVTHEMGFAREVADRVLFMDGGIIAEDAHPSKLFGDPQNPRTKEFLSKVL